MALHSRRSLRRRQQPLQQGRPSRRQASQDSRRIYWRREPLSTRYPSEYWANCEEARRNIKRPEVEGKPAIPKWESVVGKSATCSSKTAVRTTSFLSNGQHLYVENDHFYQDRLGTNTWRTQKGDVCRRSSARPPSISLGVPQQQGQQQLKELLMTRRLLSGGLLQPRATELRCGL